jgi:hypothetical protein
MLNLGSPSESMPVEIDEMTIADYDDVLSLLRALPGIAIRGADSREATERYLARNPGLSFVARCARRLVGCVMCGHDGRRGYGDRCGDVHWDVPLHSKAQVTPLSFSGHRNLRHCESTIIRIY